MELFVGACIAFALASSANAQAVEEGDDTHASLLLRVEVVLETHDPSIDRAAVLRAANDVQRDARGRARTVLHVVVPVDGDARVSVYPGEGADETFTIQRGEATWLEDALVREVRRRLVQVRPRLSSLLLTWDGEDHIDAPLGLFEWRLRENAENLAAPPRR